MIKFYLKIQNNMLTENILYIITCFVLIFNIILRIFPGKFISINKQAIIIIPSAIYTYCDVYLLLLFVILIFFFLGTDFSNSMEEISLAVGGSKSNKFMARKLVAILLLYSILYILTYANIYIAYLQLKPAKSILLPLKEAAFYSLTTNIFIIAFSLFMLFVTRDIAVSTTIITAYYLVEESLWRCKVMQKYGILRHIYQYDDYAGGEILKVKLIYTAISIIFLLISYIISMRKVNFRINIFKKSRT